MKTKTIYIILGIMAVISIFIFINSKKEVSTDISSYVVTRSFNTSSAKPGDVVRVTYTLASVGNLYSWGVLYTDTIVGGLSAPCIYNFGAVSGAILNDAKSYTPGNAVSYSYNVIANSVGTCSFIGVATFASTNIGTEKPIGGTGSFTISNPCEGLATAMNTAMNTWKTTPNVSNKNSALSAIQAWASAGC